MRRNLEALTLAVLLCMAAGCLFEEEDPIFVLALTVPSGTTHFDLTAYEGGSCDAEGQFAVGGSPSDDLNKRVTVGVVDTIVISPGTYFFEAIAISAPMNMPEVQLAAGCTEATVIAADTIEVEIELVPIQ